MMITVCGSYKFQKEMKRLAEELALNGNCVLMPTDLTKDISNYTKEDFAVLGRMHKKKIEISDAIFVVNVDDYIGESTRLEIEYAKKLNKKIIYYNKV